MSGIKSNDRYNRSIRDLADTASGLPDKLRSRIEKSVLKPEEKASLSASLFDGEAVRDKILELKVNPLWSNIKDFWHAGVKKELKEPFSRGLSSSCLAPFKDYIEALEHSVKKQFTHLRGGWEKKITEEYERERESESAEIDRAEAELQKISSFEKEILKSTSTVTQMDHHLRQDFSKALRGWREPPKKDGADVKLKKFLELWGILKSLEYYSCLK
jgi:hypothetical protein